MSCPAKQEKLGYQGKSDKFNRLAGGFPGAFDYGRARKVLVDEGLGFHDDLKRDAAGACGFAIEAEFERGPIAVFAELYPVERGRADAALGVVLGSEHQQLSQKGVNVFARHRPAPLVIVATPASKIHVAYALTAHKVSKEHVRAMLASVRYFLWHVASPGVLVWFLSPFTRGNNNVAVTEQKLRGVKPGDKRSTFDETRTANDERAAA